MASGGLKSFRKWAKCSATLDSPCMHRFFLNLSDSFYFAFTLFWCSVPCFRFRSLARSRLDRSHSISALARSFSHVYHLRISLCTDIAHEKKIAGLPQIWILTLSLQNLTPPNFCIQAYTTDNIARICKRTSKHGISVIISSQYWVMEKAVKQELGGGGGNGPPIIQQGGPGLPNNPTGAGLASPIIQQGGPGPSNNPTGRA